jgi:hypothetical protein
MSKKKQQKGREYEEFVYRKFRRLFPNAVVTFNDHIRGRESGRRRQIDISIKHDAEGQEVLWIVQCKDRGKRPADIIVLGEFSAVIRDVGAAKGILICSSGFARSNFQYARTLAIDLLTVEDIQSDRWKAEVQIPFVIIQKDSHYSLHIEFIANEQFVELNRGGAPTIEFNIDSLISFDHGLNTMTVREYFEQIWLPTSEVEITEATDIDILRPGLRLDICGIWLECSELTINMLTKKRHFLKYLDPARYTQLRDHVQNTVLPVEVAVGGPGQIDDSFIEVDENDLPVVPGFFTVLEHWSAFERAQGKGPPLDT